MNSQNRKKADVIVDQLVKTTLELEKLEKEGNNDLITKTEDEIIKLQDDFYDVPGTY